MATGRTLEKHTRIYIAGYDMSGYSRAVGPLEQTYDEPELTTWTDAAKGYLPGLFHANIGTYNAVFSNQTTPAQGPHNILRDMPGTGVTPVSLYLPDIVIAKGIRAAPAAGDPAYCGFFNMKSYQSVDDGGALTVTMGFDGFTRRTPGATTAFPTNYNPWGILLHADGSETGANTGTGFDNPTGGQTLFGGVLFVQLTGIGTGLGTATISVDNSSDNAAWVALSGASITFGLNTVNAAYIALSATATVRQYLRWQLSYAGGGGGASFVSAFCRNYHA